MLSTNTPRLCHFYCYNLLISRRSRGLIIFYFLFSRFEKVKFNIYVYIHIIFAKKIFNLVICCGEIESLLITSPKTSSTLNCVFFIISDLLST